MSAVSGVNAKTPIKFLGNWYGTADQIPIFKAMVKEFNESQNDIKVDMTMGGSDDKLRAMMAAGSVPDVIQFERSKVSTYAREGLFAPVETYVGSGVNLKRDFLPHTLQEASWKGKLYAVPMDTDVRGLFWNKRLLNEAGLDGNAGPRTWAGLKDYAFKLTKRNSNGRVEQAGFVPWNCNWNTCGWVWSFKGDLYDYNTGKPSLNSAANLKALNWLGDFAKTVVSPSQLSGSFAFAKEKVAMEADHYGALDGIFLFTNPKLLPVIGGGEVPHPEDGQNGTWSGGLSYVIPAGAKHKKEAGKFITWLMSQANQMRWYKETRGLPPSYPALEKARALMSPLEQTFVSQLPYARWRPPFFNELLGYLDNAAFDVVTGKRPPEPALDYAQNSALRQHPNFWKEKIPYVPIPKMK